MFIKIPNPEKLGIFFASKGSKFSLYSFNEFSEDEYLRYQNRL